MLSRLKQYYRELLTIREVVGFGGLPRVWSIQEFVAPYRSDALGLLESSILDIGCGAKPTNLFAAKHFYGIDIREDEQRNIRYADLVVGTIPYPDAHFDYVFAGDFLEHVPRVIYTPARRFAFVELMNEIYRVLKPNGIFLSRTPVFPFTPAFRDPTHVNIISHETFHMYFDDKTRAAAMYGFKGAFRVLKQGIRPPHLLSLLQKVPLTSAQSDVRETDNAN